MQLLSKHLFVQQIFYKLFNVVTLRDSACTVWVSFPNFSLQRRFRQLCLNPEYIFHAHSSRLAPSLKRKIHPGRLLQFPFKSHFASRWKSFGERFVTKWKKRELGVRKALSDFLVLRALSRRGRRRKLRDKSVHTAAFFLLLSTVAFPCFPPSLRLGTYAKRGEKVSETFTLQPGRRRTLNTWLVLPR